MPQHYEGSSSRLLGPFRTLVIFLSIPFALPVHPIMTLLPAISQAGYILRLLDPALAPSSNHSSAPSKRVERDIGAEQTPTANF